MQDRLKFRIGKDTLAKFVVSAFEEDPYSKQVVTLENVGKPVGHFTISIVNEADNSFFQIEQINPPELDTVFKAFEAFKVENSTEVIYRVLIPRQD